MMINYMSFLGHYKNMVDNSLCDNIINTDFQYSKSTYSNHDGISQHDERVKMDEKREGKRGVELNGD